MEPCCTIHILFALNMFFLFHLNYSVIQYIVSCLKDTSLDIKNFHHLFCIFIVFLVIKSKRKSHDLLCQKVLISQQRYLKIFFH